MVCYILYIFIYIDIYNIKVKKNSKRYQNWASYGIRHKEGKKGGPLGIYLSTFRNQCVNGGELQSCLRRISVEIFDTSTTGASSKIYVNKRKLNNTIFIPTIPTLPSLLTAQQPPISSATNSITSSLTSVTLLSNILNMQKYKTKLEIENEDLKKKVKQQQIQIDAMRERNDILTIHSYDDKKNIAVLQESNQMLVKTNNILSQLLNFNQLPPQKKQKLNNGSANNILYDTIHSLY